jgi:hypothetical protein
MTDTLPPAQIDSRWGRLGAFRWGRLALVGVGILSLGSIVSSLYSSASAPSFDPRCDAWDRAASAAVSDLIADRNPLVEQRLGDAVFRLRRARKYCRQDLVGLARLDYQALTDGRYGRGR